MSNPLAIKAYFMTHTKATLCQDCLKILNSLDIIKPEYQPVYEQHYSSNFCDICNNSPYITDNNWFRINNFVVSLIPTQQYLIQHRKLQGQQRAKQFKQRRSTN